MKKIIFALLLVYVCFIFLFVGWGLIGFNGAASMLVVPIAILVFANLIMKVLKWEIVHGQCEDCERYVISIGPESKTESNPHLCESCNKNKTV